MASSGKMDALKTASKNLLKQLQAAAQKDGDVRVAIVPFAAELFGWYVATGEGDDKAGAYAVQGQGAALVERVEGNVQAVMGLPLL